MIWGHIVFALTVCLFVLFVCLSPTLTLIITFQPVQIETSYLACICISYSHTFWGVTYKGQGHPSRSKVKYIGHIIYFNISHIFWTSTDRELMFSMHVHLIYLHIFRIHMSRWRSPICPFKVKYTCQLTDFNIIHNFWTSTDRHLIFGMHVYLMKPHILTGSHIKVNVTQTSNI